MLMPFIQLPDGIELLNQTALEGEGEHGCTFELRAIKPMEGDLLVGFKDIQTGKIIRQKEIHVIGI